MSEEHGWELFEKSDISTEMPDSCKTTVSLYRKRVPAGWLVLAMHVFDRRQKLGRLDISLRSGRILSVQAESSLTFVPDPEREWDE